MTQAATPDLIPLQAAKQALPGWRIDAERPALIREFEFADFSEAFGFMAQIAVLAEKWDHHPEWSNVYNRVSVLLTTHDAGGVTERDIRLAKAMDAAVRTRQSSPD